MPLKDWQTLANVYQLDNDLEILPVIKMTCQLQIKTCALKWKMSSGWMLLKLSSPSAKAGIGIEKRFWADRWESSSTDGCWEASSSLEFLTLYMIIVGWFFRFVWSMEWLNQAIDQLMSNSKTLWCHRSWDLLLPKAVGHFLATGDVGFTLAASIQTVADTRVGDRWLQRPASRVVPTWIQQIDLMVFAGLYPIESNQHTWSSWLWKRPQWMMPVFNLITPEKLLSPLVFELRCGFLGTLHMDVIKRARLEREFQYWRSWRHRL